MMSFASLFGALVLAIVPTQARDATRGLIKVRGGDDGPSEVKAAQADAKVFEGRTRIAVLPFAVPEGNAALASQRTGGMDSIIADLRYVPTYLISDRSEVLAAAPKQADPSTIGAELGVKALIQGTMTGDGTDLAIELTYFEIDGKTAKAVATAKATGPKSDIYALSDQALLGLLAKVKMTPAEDRLDEIKKVPTQSFDAKSHADAGFALLDQLSTPDLSAEKVADLNKKALEHAKAALKSDRNYLSAYMLRASCLYNLGLSTELKDCLVAARKKNDPQRADTLCGLEIEADYLTFHDGQFAQAAKEYEKILKYDPGNMHALWSLTGLYSGHYGAGELAKSPHAKEKAARYASQLVLAHPKSAAAELFAPKPSQP